MKILLNHIKEQDKKLIEAFGGTKDDVTYSVDDDGIEVMVVSEAIAPDMMQAIAGVMVEKGIWTAEDAQHYLEHGSDE